MTSYSCSCTYLRHMGVQIPSQLRAAVTCSSVSERSAVLSSRFLPHSNLVSASESRGCGQGLSSKLAQRPSRYSKQFHHVLSLAVGLPMCSDAGLRNLSHPFYVPYHSFTTITTTDFAAAAPKENPLHLPSADIADNPRAEVLQEYSTDTVHQAAATNATLSGVAPQGTGVLSQPTPHQLTDSSISSSTVADQVLHDQQKLLVVIDLDETLFYSHLNRESEYDFCVKMDKQDAYVRLRPGCKEFLRWCSERFEIGIYTAGTEAYAKAVLAVLDPGGHMINPSNHRYRGSCWPVNYELRVGDKDIVQTLYAKDLALFRRDLSRVVLVDNSLFSFMLQPDNGIPISNWVGRTSSATGNDNNNNKHPPVTAILAAAVVHAPTVGSAPAASYDNVVQSLKDSGPVQYSEAPLSSQSNLSLVTSATAATNEGEHELFGDFYPIKETLEALESLDDVKPVLRQKYRVVDHIVQKCINGMIIKTPSPEVPKKAT